MSGSAKSGPYRPFHADPSLEVREVGGKLGSKIACFLKSDKRISEIAFPVLRRFNPTKKGYGPCGYRDVGSLIGQGRVAIYETRHDQKWEAMYHSSKAGDSLVLTPRVANNLNGPSALGSILHESTHLVQDWRGMRMSLLEAEIDAHFAEALFLIRGGHSLAGSYLNLEAAAEIYNDDSDYLSSRRFRTKVLPQIEGEVINACKKAAQAQGKSFNPKEFRRNFRWDGVA